MRPPRAPQVAVTGARPLRSSCGRRARALRRRRAPRRSASAPERRAPPRCLASAAPLAAIVPGDRGRWLDSDSTYPSLAIHVHVHVHVSMYPYTHPSSRACMRTSFRVSSRACVSARVSLRARLVLASCLANSPWEMHGGIGGR